MSLLEIVYCYVTETIPFVGDFSKLKESFKDCGYKEKQISETVWKYTRGPGLALEFNYDSEAIQMQVFLERPNQENLSIKVGNWGFPFEPLLMKKRFKKNLQKIVDDISAFQILEINEEEIRKIEQDGKKKKRSAIYLLVAVFAASILYNIINYLL